MLRKNKGFTLIELMIVVAILAILAVIAIPNFTSIIDRARESATKGTLGALRDAIVEYYGMTEGHLPVKLDDTLFQYELGDGSTITVSFLPGNGPVLHPQTGDVVELTDSFEGFFPADPNDPSKPCAYTKLRRGIGKVDNTVTIIDPNVKAAEAGTGGGWLYYPGDGKTINDKALVTAQASNGEVRTRYLNAGDICINNREIDSTGKTFYIEY